MSNDEPLDHVLRTQPPWRDEPAITECGRAAETVTYLTREQFAAKVARQGQKRSSLTSCMTCWQTAVNYRTWDQDPVQAMHREAGRRLYVRDGAANLLRDELRAIAELVDRHKEEFDGLLAGIRGATQLDDHRNVRRLRK